jgi:hypothetical protein
MEGEAPPEPILAGIDRTSECNGSDGASPSVGLDQGARCEVSSPQGVENPQV